MAFERLEALTVGSGIGWGDEVVATRDILLLLDGFRPAMGFRSRCERLDEL